MPLCVHCLKPCPPIVIPKVLTKTDGPPMSKKQKHMPNAYMPSSHMPPASIPKMQSAHLDEIVNNKCWNVLEEAKFPKDLQRFIMTNMTMHEKEVISKATNNDLVSGCANHAYEICRQRPRQA